MNQQIIRKKEVCRATGLSYSTIYRLEKMGRFPRRRRLGDWAVGWVVREIEEWIHQRHAIETPKA